MSYLKNKYLYAFAFISVPTQKGRQTNDESLNIVLKQTEFIEQQTARDRSEKGYLNTTQTS